MPNRKLIWLVCVAFFGFFLFAALVLAVVITGIDIIAEVLKVI